MSDHYRGICAQLDELMETGALAASVGMLTDSRSFTSFVRHEYFRRILCRRLGEIVESGMYPSDINALGRIVSDICYNNAVRGGIYMMTSLLYPVDTVSRRAVSLNGMWGFRLDPSGIGTSEGWQKRLPDPDLIPVPSSFQDLYTDKFTRDYCGDFWYEKDVFVPAEWRGSSVSVRFGCATHKATVYVNGAEIVSHEGGFLPFSADLYGCCSLWRDEPYCSQSQQRAQRDLYAMRHCQNDNGWQEACCSVF